MRTLSLFAGSFLAALVLQGERPRAADTNESAPIKMTADEFFKAFAADTNAAMDRFDDQHIELTGELRMFDVSYSGGSYIFLGGSKWEAVHEEPWALALPGQTIKVTGQFKRGVGIRFTIVEAQGERLTVTAKDLTTQFARNAEAVNKKYGEKWIEVRGVVKQAGDNDDGVSIVLAGAGKGDVVCYVPPEEIKDVKVGDDVRLVGQYNQFASESPQLTQGRVITVPAEVAAKDDDADPATPDATTHDAAPDDTASDTPAPSKLRTWTSADGKFKVEAELVKMVASTVHLKTKDGREINVPRAKLSKADQQFLTRPPR